MNEYLYQIISANGRMSNTNGKISKQIDIFPFAERYYELFFFSGCPFTPRGRARQNARSPSICTIRALSVWLNSIMRKAFVMQGMGFVPIKRDKKAVNERREMLYKDSGSSRLAPCETSPSTAPGVQLFRTRLPAKQIHQQLYQAKHRR